MDKKAVLGLLIFICEDLGMSSDDISELVAEMQVNFNEYSKEEMISRFNKFADETPTIEKEF
ncbi:hypothetical protein [Paenibacillus dendritiformis]|uniref:hypothetical protein n=1 Tax=Paenibacillus dendritiformis TaxID=130049 RepID=UPI00387E1ED6